MSTPYSLEDPLSADTDAETAGDSDAYTFLPVGSIFDIYNSTAPPISSIYTSTSKLGTNQTVFTVSAYTDRSGSYELYVDGKLVDEGYISLQYTTLGAVASATVADGTHSYDFRFLNSYGIYSSRTGSFYCDTIAPKNLGSLSVTQNNDVATFSWAAATDTNSFTYELAYKTIDATDYTVQTGLTSTSCNVFLTEDTIWEWRVRAVDVYGNATDWIDGSQFSNDDTPATLSASVSTPWKISVGKSQLTINWYANEESTYSLLVDGVKLYNGSGNSHTFQVRDGYHQYSVISTDRSGNKSTWTGAFRTDTTPPNVPTALNASVWNNIASFSWGSTSDVSGVTYDVRYKRTQDDDYTVISGITSTYRAVSLLAEGIWNWEVRAVDGNGNASAWGAGGNFSNDVTAPVIRMNSLVQKKISSNNALMTFSWAGNEVATYTLLVDGAQKYSGTGAGCSVKMKDGTHKYVLTAVDASGNSRRISASFRVDTIAPKKPSRVKVAGRGRTIKFSWKGVKDSSGVTYQLRYKRVQDAGYTICNVGRRTSLTKRFGPAIWRWSVRAVDGCGNVSAWVNGKKFNNDKTPPVVSLNVVGRQTIKSGLSKMTLRLVSNEPVTYTLKIDGKTVYKGKKLNFNINQKDGKHKYTVIARDKSGNTRRKSGTYFCDATAPSEPTGMRVLLGGNRVYLSWSSVYDVSGVTYDIGFRCYGQAKYTYATGVKNTSMSVLLAGEHTWEWIIRAVDGNGNASSWAYRSFNNYGTASALSGSAQSSASATAAPALDKELNLSAGALANLSLPTADSIAADAASLPGVDTQKQEERTLLAAVA